MNPLDCVNDEELGRLAAVAARMPDAPPSWIDAATALWTRTARADAAPEATLARRVAAIVRFDNWAVSPLALGVRSLRGAGRHLLYSAEGRDVDVRITPAAGRFLLAGQVLGPDETGHVELAAAGAAGRRLVQLDALGEFHVDALDAGTYELVLRMGADEIVLPPIVVGERSG